MNMRSNPLVLDEDDSFRFPACQRTKWHVRRARVSNVLILSLVWFCIDLVIFCLSFSALPTRPELASPRGPRCSRSDACVHTLSGVKLVVIGGDWRLVCHWCYHCVHWNHLGVKRTKYGKTSATIACRCTWQWHSSILGRWSFSSNGLREQESYSWSEQQIKQCLYSVMLSLHLVIWNLVLFKESHKSTGTNYCVTYVTLHLIFKSYFCHLLFWFCFYMDLLLILYEYCIGLILVISNVYPLHSAFRFHPWRYLAKVRDWRRWEGA